MFQINVRLLKKLIEDEPFENLRREALVGFPRIVDQRLIPLDDDSPCIEKGRKKLGSLFTILLHLLQGLCKDALRPHEHEEQAEGEECFRENDHEHLCFLICFLIALPPGGIAPGRNAEEPV